MTKRKNLQRIHLQAIPALREPASAAQAGDRPPLRKTARECVIALLRAADGASLADLAAITGWQAHSLRAMLTRLRKKGHVLILIKADGVSRYIIPQAATGGDSEVGAEDIHRSATRRAISRSSARQNSSGDTA